MTNNESSLNLSSSVDLNEAVAKVCRQAKQAAAIMAVASTMVKNEILRELSRLIANHREAILEANNLDVTEAEKNGLSRSMLARLTLTRTIIDEMLEGLEEVAELPDPVGVLEEKTTRPNGLEVARMRVPLGVIGFIYESRPNVTVDAAALCLKSGNAVVLKGGKEAIHSNQYLAKLIAQALHSQNLPPAAVSLLPFTERRATQFLLRQDKYLDVIIPRGGESLIRFTAENATVPVLKHYKGVCHIYIDKGADLNMAASICRNAKTQKPSACNALETILIHRDEAAAALALLNTSLDDVEIRGCELTRLHIPRAVPAREEDYAAEFLDMIVAVKIVKDMEEALQHIAAYSSNHTESIITRDQERAERFLAAADSSVVLVNASTRFNDGWQLGLGSEIGISTSKLHAFGPMGLKELTARKFVVHGEGQVRL
ncbi:MAG: glutamate-5-semialdehyde dehydrogenase [Desulfarculales bacterium]|jgi:glutamate-5-semialdehyde dehydrogenase|nr:glutamate-5-semialdehyde dehydrogenase [Desulfarculales bacterium]